MAARKPKNNRAEHSLRPEKVTPTSVGILATASKSRLDLVGTANEKTTVSGVTLRAQEVRPGDLFAALPGATTHGASFIADVIHSGATAVLTDPAGRAIIDNYLLSGGGGTTAVEIAEFEAELANREFAILVHPRPRMVVGALSSRIYSQPSRRLKLIGITGTSGKTTTAYFVEAALTAAGKRVGLLGTVETRIAGLRQPSALTTPEAPELQGILAAMVERGVDSVVMEVSSHALQLGRVEGSIFATGAFTNLSQDHLDFHHTMREYFEAKAILFQEDSSQSRSTQSRSTQSRSNGGVTALRSVICVDDEYGRLMAKIAGPQAITVSTTGAPAQWSAGVSKTLEQGGQSVVITDPQQKKYELIVPLPGRYNIANALLALVIAVNSGVALTQAISGIAKVNVPGRLEKIEAGQKFLAIVDYAHKPGAVEAVIATLREQTSGRLAVVLGAGGDRDKEKRALMGAAAARGAHFVVVTDDNPRTEDPAIIRSAVLSGAKNIPKAERTAVKISEIADRREAIAAAVNWARPGDIVLIAGKGHEVGQEINGVKHHFDDREELRNALENFVTATSKPSAK